MSCGGFRIHCLVNSVCWSPYEYGACVAAVSSDGFMSCIYQKSKEVLTGCV